MKNFRAWIKSLFTITFGETKVMDTIAASTTVKQLIKVDTGTEIAAESPAAEVKAGVNDFEAAWAFLESGVEQAWGRSIRRAEGAGEEVFIDALDVKAHIECEIIMMRDDEHLFPRSSEHASAVRVIIEVGNLITDFLTLIGRCSGFGTCVGRCGRQSKSY